MIEPQRHETQTMDTLFRTERRWLNSFAQGAEIID